MKYLTRQEEMALLAVFRLKENAYLVSIGKVLQEFTGKEWSVSSVYVPLDRLEKNGLLSSHLGEATEKRGGKAIKYYSLTRDGVKALAEVKAVHNTMWDGLEEAIIRRGYE